MVQLICRWLARCLCWGTVAVGVGAGLAMRQGPIGRIIWGIALLAVALSIIDQILFTLEERGWVLTQLSMHGFGRFMRGVFFGGLPYHFLLRFATMTGLGFLIYWIAKFFG